MNRFFLKFLFAVALTVLCSLSLLALELLENGDLRTDDGRLPGWELPDGNANVVQENVPQNALNSEQSLQLEAKHQWVVAETVFHAVEGQEYHIGYWRRLQDAKATHEKIAWFDSAGKHVDTFLTSGQEETQAWTRFDHRAIAPKDAVTGVLQLLVGGENDCPGCAWYAAFSVTPAAPAAHLKALEARKPRIETRHLGQNALKPKGEAVELDLEGRSIVIPQKPSGQERYAAQLLSRLLRAIYQQDFPVVPDAQPLTGPFLSVGDTAPFRANGLKPHLDRQDYVLAEQDNVLYFLGGAGPLYAVLAFLQEDLGCRFYTADDAYAVPADTPSLVAVVPRSFAPPFEVREPLNGTFLHRDDFNAFNRVQAVSYFKNVPEALGGGLSNTQYFIHTYDSLVSAAKYYDTHPEYFPLRDGKRFHSTQHEGQLCYTNPEVAEVMAAELQQAIALHPGSRIYSVSQNDNIWVECECPECQKIIQTDGVPGAALLLANRVAEPCPKHCLTSASPRWHTSRRRSRRRMSTLPQTRLSFTLPSASAPACWAACPGKTSRK